MVGEVRDRFAVGFETNIVAATGPQPEDEETRVVR
jgi:hypothetical protein